MSSEPPPPYNPQAPNRAQTNPYPPSNNPGPSYGAQYKPYPPPYHAGPSSGVQYSQYPQQYNPGPSYGPPPGSARQQQTVITMQPGVGASAVVVIPGGNCPVCRAGVLQSEFTCCGICMCILFFPLGMLCCYLMRNRRCTNCRVTYS